MAEVDLQALTTKLLRLEGMHNYTPLDLHEALGFMACSVERYALSTIVRDVLPLAEIDAALELMESDPSVLRIALSP